MEIAANVAYAIFGIFGLCVMVASIFRDEAERSECGRPMPDEDGFYELPKKSK